MKGKEIFLKLQLKENEYIKQISTNDIIKDKLELWYGIADKNGYYYDYPIFDDINDYEIYIDNNKYLLKDYLKENNYLNNHFAIISTTKNNILGIETFPVNRCNSFYSIPLNTNFYDILKTLDLNKITIKRKLFNNMLIEYETQNHKYNTGYELLMFLESKDKNIMNILNQERIKLLTKIAYEIKEHKMWGDYILFIPNLTIINFTKDLKNDLETFIVNKEINQNELFKLNKNTKINYDTTVWLMQNLHQKQRQYEMYYFWYIRYIEKIFSNLESLDVLDSKPNFLVYGFYDEEVGNEVFKQ